MHNRNITYSVTLTLVLLFSLSYLNKKDTFTVNNILSAGLPIATVNSAQLPLIQNTKSSQIQKIIFSPSNLKSSLNYITQNNDTLDSYLINIFCMEAGSNYVKVASGSGVFLSSPDDTTGIILTNAHVARHLLDVNKKCVGRTGSPTTTTHTLTLRYIPYHWLNDHNKYVIGDPDQSSTGEYDFAIIESTRTKPIKKDASNIYTALKTNPKLKISNYDENNFLNNIYIYSYPAQVALTKNIYNPLYQKKDIVKVSSVYASPSENIQDSLLDVVGSKNVDHGSSGGMVISQGSSNAIIGLSSILIQSNAPQTVRVVTINHVLSTIKNDLKIINNAQTDSFLSIIQDTLLKKETDMSVIQILKNIKLTSVLEQYTRETLRKLNIIR
ncbi:hypothetical protein H7Y21_04080 [Arenimonas sp.]|nr:hypothetical protein [Candidatus Parcubacteria bacterium]